MFPELSTPAFLVNLDRVERNTRVMLEKAKRSGVTLRPHLKTHKTVEGARLQVGAASGPVTVSTLAEAEHFAAAGFDDITWAVPVALDKLPRVAALTRKIRRFHILLDHPSAFQAVEQFASSNKLTIRCFLKVDCGYHRAGVDPADPGSLDLARAIAGSKVLRLEGLLTHAGHSYHARTPAEIAALAREESDAVDQFRRRLGMMDLVRSVGSTPTISIPTQIENADEARPGNYIFFDAFQAAVGSCTLHDCAATVLASVIGVYPAQQKLLVDAGALALSKDPGPVHVDPDCGYGVVLSARGEVLPFRVTSISQEHGQLHAQGAVDLNDYPVGTRVRIIPNHSCLTAALFDRFVVERNGQVVGEWRPVRGW